MNIKNTERSYGLVAIAIHWLTAITVIGLFALGWWMVDLTYYDDWYRTGPYIHKSIGIIVAAVFIFRVIWRVVNVEPKLPNSVVSWEKKIATLVHMSLYGLVFLIVISGYLISTADGRAIEVFNWFEIPAFVTPIENQEDLAGDIHFYLASALMTLVALHGLAALKHHFLNKDATLKRMLNPNLKSLDENS